MIHPALNNALVHNQRALITSYQTSSKSIRKYGAKQEHSIRNDEIEWIPPPPTPLCPPSPELLTVADTTFIDPRLLSVIIYGLNTAVIPRSPNLTLTLVLANTITINVKSLGTQLHYIH